MIGFSMTTWLIVACPFLCAVSRPFRKDFESKGNGSASGTSGLVSHRSSVNKAKLPLSEKLRSLQFLDQLNARSEPQRSASLGSRGTSASRSFSVCAGSRETSFDEGVYVLDRGVFDHLIQWAALWQFVFAHSKKDAPMTKPTITEMIVANFDHFGRSHGFPWPNGFSAPV